MPGRAVEKAFSPSTRARRERYSASNRKALGQRSAARPPQTTEEKSDVATVNCHAFVHHVGAPCLWRHVRRVHFGTPIGIGGRGKAFSPRAIAAMGLVPTMVSGALWELGGVICPLRLFSRPAGTVGGP